MLKLHSKQYLNVISTNVEEKLKWHPNIISNVIKTNMFKWHLQSSMKILDVKIDQNLDLHI